MKTRIVTEEAPKAVGPYSQGILFTPAAGQKLIFVSGMLPVDPATGRMEEGDIKLLTRRIILNLDAVLKKGGGSLQSVLKTEVFLIDFKNDYPGMNEEYAQWFTGQAAPARQTIQVAQLPLGSRIEISCIGTAD